MDDQQVTLQNQQQCRTRPALETFLTAYLFAVTRLFASEANFCSVLAVNASSGPQKLHHSKCSVIETILRQLDSYPPAAKKHIGCKSYVKHACCIHRTTQGCRSITWSLLEATVLDDIAKTTFAQLVGLEPIELLDVALGNVSHSNYGSTASGCCRVRFYHNLRVASTRCRIHLPVRPRATTRAASERQDECRIKLLILRQ